MALEEQHVIDQLEILRDGTVQVREAREILRDGVIVSKEYLRYVISIEEEFPDLSRLDEFSKSIVLAARTPDKLGAAKERNKNIQSPQP